jgi:hypothetical protein
MRSRWLRLLCAEVKKRILMENSPSLSLRQNRKMNGYELSICDKPPQSSPAYLSD